MTYTYLIRLGTGLTGVIRPAVAPPVAPDDTVQAPLAELLLTPGCTIELGAYNLDGTARATDTIAAASLTVEPWGDDDE